MYTQTLSGYKRTSLLSESLGEYVTIKTSWEGIFQASMTFFDSRLHSKVLALKNRRDLEDLELLSW